MGRAGGSFPRKPKIEGEVSAAPSPGGGGGATVPGNNKGVAQGDIRPAQTDAAQANPSLGRQIWDATKREIPGVGAYYHGSDAIDAWKAGNYGSALGSAYEAAENVVPIGKGVKLVRMGLKYGFKKLIKKEIKDEVKKEAKDEKGGADKSKCKVAPYKDLVCDKGYDKHHIVPRFYAKQVGVSDDEGPSVCSANGFHQKWVHGAINSSVERMSDMGEIPMKTIVGIGITKAALGADATGCKAKIAAATLAKFGPHMNKMVKTP